MKTTVKLDPARSLVIEPHNAEGAHGVRLAIRVGSVTVGSMVLAGDILGAAMFGIESAAEVAAGNHERARPVVMAVIPQADKARGVSTC